MEDNPSTSQLPSQQEEEDEDDFTLFDLIKEDEEYLQLMIQKETHFSFDSSGFDHHWIKSARVEAISWIFKSRENLGFRLPTLYLSISYFDRFLSKSSINSEKQWAVRLLSVACLSLAAKMEEINSPQLPQFQLEDYNFEAKTIQRMELLVLNTLQWRMISITPFHFLHYFFNKFCINADQIMVSRAVGLILALIKEINLMGHRPSVIAAAAALMALDQSLTREELESRVSSISSYGSIEIEKVFECYNRMKRLEIDEIERCSSIGRKRKRSDFINSDQHHDQKQQKL